jgi:hypothetical protein
MSFINYYGNACFICNAIVRIGITKYFDYTPWLYVFLSVVISTVEEMFVVGPFVVSALFLWVNFERAYFT